MKKTFKMVMFATAASLMLSSCYTYTTVVGSGAKGTETVKKWNNYLIDGLIPIGVSDAKAMAGGASDYTVTVSHSFVNGLLSAITFGIYSPTTTTVMK